LYEGKTDREIYVEMRRAVSELLRRYEQFLELVPSREDERDLSREQAARVRITERELRGFYERCRDIRETLEDGPADWEEYERSKGK